MKAIARAHLLREMQNEKGDWLEKRVAYVTSNGSIDVDNVIPTSFKNHGHNVRVRLQPSQMQRTYRDVALMMMAEPMDKMMKDGVRIQAT